MSSTYASTYETFAPESDNRSAVATVDFIESNQKGFYPFQAELKKKENAQMGWGDVLIARENGTLVEYECGDCACETAGLLPNGDVRYWRFLTRKERVAVIDDKAIFVVKCGNPVRCTRAPWMKPKIIPPAPPSPQPPPAPPEAPQRSSNCRVTEDYTAYWPVVGPGQVWIGPHGSGISPPSTVAQYPYRQIRIVCGEE